MLLDAGQKYLGGIEELIGFAQSAVSPPFDRSEDDKVDWITIAQEACKVNTW